MPLPYEKPVVMQDLALTDERMREIAQAAAERVAKCTSTNPAVSFPLILLTLQEQLAFAGAAPVAQPLAPSDWEAGREDCDGNVLAVMRQDELALAADFIRHDALQSARIDGRDISRQQMMCRLINASSNPRVQPLAPSGAAPRTVSCNLIDYSRHIAQQQAMGLQPMGLAEFARAVTYAAAQPLAASAVPEGQQGVLGVDRIVRNAILGNSHPTEEGYLMFLTEAEFVTVGNQVARALAAAPRQEAQPAVQVVSVADLPPTPEPAGYSEYDAPRYSMAQLFDYARESIRHLAAPSQQPAASPTDSKENK